MDEATRNESPATPPSTAPRCYRHPDRETLVSCGRCGRPLCPDCVVHGPVGVRCRECLQPAKTRIPMVVEQESRGIQGAVVTGMLSLLVLAAVTVGIALLVLPLQTVLLEAPGLPPPNLLLSGVAGGLVGWVTWRRCDRRASARTTWWAVAVAILVPCLAALAVVGVALTHGGLLTVGRLFLPRLLFAAAISGFFAWLLATQQAA